MNRIAPLVGILLVASMPVAGRDVQSLLQRISPQPTEVMQFLQSPGTVVFEEIGIEWSTYEVYLMKGEVISGGCRYANPSRSPLYPSRTPTESTTASETLATNIVSCTQLLIRGVPLKSSADALKAWFAQLGDNVSAARQSDAAPMTAAAAEPETVNDHASSHIHFTDGNNPRIKDALTYFNMLADIVGYGTTLRNGLTILRLSAEIGYSYLKDTTIVGGCAAQWSQASKYENRASVGSAWVQQAGGSPGLVRRFVSDVQCDCEHFLRKGI